MLAYNEMGDGELSEPVVIGRHSSEAVKSPLINEPWFIATIISVVGAAVWLVLCLFSIWIYRRHRAGKKIPKNRAKPVTVHTSTDAMRSAYTANQMPLLSTNMCIGGSQMTNQPLPYINGSYRGNQPRMAPCCYDNESPSDGDSKATGSLIGHTYQTLESLQHNEIMAERGNSNGHCPTFYNRATIPVTMPYATTTLVCPANSRNPSAPGVGGCIPNPQAYMIQLQPSESGDGCCKKDIGGTPVDLRNEQSCFAASTQPRLFLPPPPDLSDHDTLPTSEFGRPVAGFEMTNSQCCHDTVNNCYGLPPAYSAGDRDVRRLNLPMDRSAEVGTFSNQFVDSTPVLTDPRLLDYDAYGDCNATDVELAVDSMLVDVPESDADSLSESSSEHEHSLQATNNFTDILAHVAENSGQNSSFHSNDAKEKGRRPARHRQRAARPSSPYSTDSNYSSAAAPQPRRPYPKSERRKQLAVERGNGSGGSGADCSSDPQPANGFHDVDRFRSVGNNSRKPFQNGSDQPPFFTKPPVPYSTVNSSRSSHGSGTASSIRAAPIVGIAGSQLQHGDGEIGSSRPNPLAVFDTHDTQIV
jgi:hypothetical protein